MENKIVTGKLGEMVTYVGSAGYPKAAMVVGTPESVVPGTNIPELADGERHLMVFSVTGVVYTKLTVPYGPFNTPDGSVVNTGVWFATV